MSAVMVRHVFRWSHHGFCPVSAGSTVMRCDETGGKSRNFQTGFRNFHTGGSSSSTSTATSSSTSTSSSASLTYNINRNPTNATLNSSIETSSASSESHDGPRWNRNENGSRSNNLLDPSGSNHIPFMRSLVGSSNRGVECTRESFPGKQFFPSYTNLKTTLQVTTTQATAFDTGLSPATPRIAARLESMNNANSSTVASSMTSSPLISSQLVQTETTSAAENNTNESYVPKSINALFRKSSQTYERPHATASWTMTGGGGSGETGTNPTANSKTQGVRRSLTTSTKKLSINITRQQMVRENQQSFSECYDIPSVREQLGEGAFGTVVKAIHKTTGINRAAKKIPKVALEDQKLFENEVESLMQLDHPHIVKLVEYFDEKDMYILVFEMCHGPDLFDRIVDVITDRRKFEEIEAGRLLRHMLKAILCCHSHHIIHRDIKPENYMFSRADPRSSLKMIDLGLSEHYTPADMRKSAEGTPIGTVAYMSPEMLLGKEYDKQCDIWSLGVILWAILVGEPLFTHECDKLCEEQILDPKYLVEEMKKLQSRISPEARDILTQMLMRDPKDRISAQDALAHPFISKSYSPADYADRNVVDRGNATALFDKNVLNKMEKFVQLPALKRVGLFVFAHLCGTDGDDTRLYRVTFRQMDKMGTGCLSKEDFLKGIKGNIVEFPVSMHIPSSFIDAETKMLQDPAVLDLPMNQFMEKVFPFMDSNNSGNIDFIEFLAATIEVEQVAHHEKVLRGVFQLMDINRIGYLALDDMADLLSSNTLEELEAMLLEVAPNGKMNYEQFKDLMLRKEELIK